MAHSTTSNQPSANQSTSGLDDNQQRALRRSQWLAKWLDAKFGIPGTRLQFGIESLVGLIPVIGDYAGALMSAVIVADAARAGASKPVLGRMIGNILLEMLVGIVPIAGDIFDFFFKANMRNADLLQKELSKQTHASPNLQQTRKKTSLLWVILFVLGLFGLITAFWIGIGYLIFG